MVRWSDEGRGARACLSALSELCTKAVMRRPAESAQLKIPWVDLSASVDAVCHATLLWATRLVRLVSRKSNGTT